MEVKTKGKDSEVSMLRLGGKIVLVGFSLEPIEMIVVKKIIGTYAKKINEHLPYQELKITLRKTKKEKSFLHEINVNVKTEKGNLVSDIAEKNLYTALSEALNKTKHQAEHKEEK